MDAIEAEGLIPSPPSRFGDMLARTGPALGQDAVVYADAEVLHFCSARVAWQLARENPVNIAQCPLSMAIYTRPDEPEQVHLAWRQTLGDSAGSRAADALLERIAAQVAANAGHAGSRRAPRSRARHRSPRWTASRRRSSRCRGCRRAAAGWPRWWR